MTTSAQGRRGAIAYLRMTLLVVSLPADLAVPRVARLPLPVPQDLPE